ncbi:MAG: hypothetical protein JO244_04825 [Solirubrobacterales bacterium]|nr:hypothetical protein [Solirubrobacterales bacterium]
MSESPGKPRPSFAGSVRLRLLGALIALAAGAAALVVAILLVRSALS